MKKVLIVIGIVISIIIIMFFLVIAVAKSGVSSYEKSQRHQKIEYVPKFKEGDIVYLKPDSLKVVIEGFCPCSKNKYDVYYFDTNKQKIKFTTTDKMIF
jgi:hypothetical protein